MTIVNTIYTHKVTSANADATLVPTTPDFIMATLVVCNTSGSNAVVTAKIADGNGTELSRILHEEVIAAGDAVTLDLNSLNVPKTSYQFMVRSSVTGVHFTASGGAKI